LRQAFGMAVNIIPGKRIDQVDRREELSYLRGELGDQISFGTTAELYSLYRKVRRDCEESGNLEKGIFIAEVVTAYSPRIVGKSYTDENAQRAIETFQEGLEYEIQNKSEDSRAEFIKMQVQNRAL